MTVTVGEFKQDKYDQLAMQVRDVLMTHANEKHLTLAEAIGVLEVVKIELYNEQLHG